MPTEMTTARVPRWIVPEPIAQLTLVGMVWEESAVQEKSSIGTPVIRPSWRGQLSCDCRQPCRLGWPFP
ncbi:hypothetical protein QYR03_07710 [Corynebacterium sp. P4-C1]|nr:MULTISPECIES: hypothetical protein [unclassified Corynebacterium]MDN8594365.1 hypothetical protein [Corynebacterium sp. P4_F2]WKK55094.1 hypothetical protein QYR03_07710 [Corynebacterium sp. P4-C1]